MPKTSETIHAELRAELERREAELQALRAAVRALDGPQARKAPRRPRKAASGAQNGAAA